MTKDQLRTKLVQKEEEIRRLHEAEERGIKEAELLGEEMKEMADKVEAMEDELEALRKRDKLATEIIGHPDANRTSESAQLRYLVTDWMQLGMSLSR